MSPSRTGKVLFLMFGRALASAAGLIALAVLARTLSTRDLATYNQAFAAFQFSLPFLMLGLAHSLLFFLAAEARRLRAVLLENLLLLTGLGLLFAVFLVLGGNRLLARSFNNPALARALLLFAPYAVLVMPAHAVDACLVARNRVSRLVTFNVLSRLVGSGLILLSALWWRRVEPAILAAVLGAAIALGPALWLMLDACPGADARPTWSGMAAMLKFSVPLGIGHALTGMAFALDKILVSVFCSPEQFAVYVLGAVEIPLIGILTMAVLGVITPEMSRSCKEGRPAEATDLWQRAFVKSSTILLPAMGLLLALAPEVVTVLFSPRYAGSAHPLRVYALLMPTRAASFTALFSALNRTRAMTWGGGLMLALNLVLSLFLIPLFGPIGAAWGTVISYWGMAVFLAWRAAPSFGIRMRELVPWRPWIRMMAMVLVSGALTWALVRLLPAHTLLRLAAGTALYGVLIAALFQVSGMLDAREFLSRLRGGLEREPVIPPADVEPPV